MFQVFVAGGKISRREINSATWTEFDPDGEDLYFVRVPRVEGAVVYYTNTSTFPDLVDGSPIEEEHILDGAEDWFPGRVPYGFDRDESLRDKPGYVRHFFAVVPDEAPAPGAAPITARMTFTAGLRK